MTALSVTAEQAAQSESATTEAAQVIMEGAKVESTEVIPPLPEMDAVPDALKDFIESIVISVVRSLALQPMQLMQCSSGSMPPAAPAARLVFVDGQYLAVSNGSTWRLYAPLP